MAIPTWAAASQQDDPAPTQSSQMSDPMGTMGMMGMMDDMPGMEGHEGMSEMMNDPKMEEQMRSMMSGMHQAPSTSP